MAAYPEWWQPGTAHRAGSLKTRWGIPGSGPATSMDSGGALNKGALSCFLITCCAAFFETPLQPLRGKKNPIRAAPANQQQRTNNRRCKQSATTRTPTIRNPTLASSYHCSVKVGGKGQTTAMPPSPRPKVPTPERTATKIWKPPRLRQPTFVGRSEPSVLDRRRPPERANGATYREIEIALPRELDPDQRQALVLDFIRQRDRERHARNGRSTIRRGAGGRRTTACPSRTRNGRWTGSSGGRAVFQTVQQDTSRVGEVAGKTVPAQEERLETRQRWAEAERPPPTGPRGAVDHRNSRQGIDRAPEQHFGGRRVSNWHRNSGKPCWSGGQPKTNSSTASGRWPSSTSRSTSTH